MKYISFLFPDGNFLFSGLFLFHSSYIFLYASSESLANNFLDASCEDAMVRKLVVPLHCSLNMLEGDTGCVCACPGSCACLVLFN